MMSKKISLDENVLRKLYVEDQIPMHEISKKLGVSVGSIHNYIKLYNIPSRPPHQGFKGKHHTETAKEKIRQKHKGRTFSKETLLKMSKSAKVGGIGHKKRGETDISQYISLTILVVLLMGTLWSIFLLWNRYLVGTYMKTSVSIISMKIEVTIEKKIYNL